MLQKVTKDAVDAIQPGQRDTFLWDSELKGFGLKTTPAGGKVYLVQYRMGGRGAPTRRYTIGRHDPWTPKMARDAARQVLAMVGKGIDPQAERRTQRLVHSQEAFAAVVESFIERHAKKNRDWQETRRLLHKNAVAAWGMRPIKTITRGDIVQLLDKVADRGAPVGANRLYAAVRKLFNWAVSRGLIETSPANGITPPGKESSRDRSLTDEELRLVWLASGKLFWPFGPAIRLLILTGQRRSEVAAMRWDEIDLEHALWTIPAERAKNNKAHEVPLSPLAVEILTDLPRVGALVFTTNGKTPISGFSKAKQRLDTEVLRLKRSEALEAGQDDVVNSLSNWIIHDLRRTMTTGLAAMGVAPHIADKILNHVQGTIRGVAAVYNRHAYLDERRRALDAWAKHIENLASGSAPSNVVALHAAT